MTFREYLTEAEEIKKKRIFLERIKNSMKKTIAGILIGCGLALSVANANANDIVENSIRPIKIENIMSDETSNQIMGKVAGETYDALKEAGITAYDKTVETAKDLTKKGMNLANSIKNKASELNTEENREKIKSKIPTKEQIKNLLKKGIEKTSEGVEKAKELINK